ncbi:MAG: hypothetical protein WCA08_01305, partial [Desulfoferrobacter sp.]
ISRSVPNSFHIITTSQGLTGKQIAPDHTCSYYKLATDSRTWHLRQQLSPRRGLLFLLKETTGESVFAYQ